MCFPHSTFFGSRGGDAPNQVHWSSTSLEKSADESVQPGWKCQHRNLDGLKNLWDFETFFTKFGSVSLLHLGGWNVWSLDIPMSVGHSNSELQIFLKNVSFILTALDTTITPPPKKNTHTRPKSLRKLFEKSKISSLGKTIFTGQKRDPCEKVYLSCFICLQSKWFQGIYI